VALHADALSEAHDALKADKELVLAAVSHHGNALMYAHDDLKADKEVVIQAARNQSSALKYASGGLNQDHEALKAAGVWDQTEEDRAYARSERATISNKFSLAQQSTDYATDFFMGYRKDPFLKSFKTFWPNAWCHSSCDPNFTDIRHRCRGTLSTCSKPEVSPEGRATDDSCWRFAYRKQQEYAKETNGFLVMPEEVVGLGAGQQIEIEMSRELNLKVFKTYTDHKEFNSATIRRLGEAIEEWYASGCANQDLENVYLGCGTGNRPRYEKL